MTLTKKERLAIAKRTREILRPGGTWMQGFFRTRRRYRGKDIECYCLAGAVAKAFEFERGYYSGYHPILNFAGCIVRAAEGKAVSPTRWNDDPKRKKSEVIAAIDAYIAKLS